MSSSIREAIILGMVNALTAAQMQLGATVARSYRDLTPRSATPSVVVTPADETTTVLSDAGTAGVDRNVLLVDVEIAVRGDPYDQIADAIAVAAHATLMSWANAPSSPLMYQFRRESTQWSSQAADLTAGVLSMRYRVIYLTDANDLSKVGAPG